MRILAVLTCLLFAGCLAGGNDNGVADEPETSGQPAGRESVELGRYSVNTPGPGPHTFTVTVPPGGADDVRWQLTITGPALTSTVSGHGCSGGANVNVMIAIVGSSTRGGSCNDLPAGDAEFTVNLTDPALAFTAKILGTVKAQP